MLFGLEAEYLLIGNFIETLLARQLSVTAEFFRFMVELITKPYDRAETAVAELEHQVQKVEIAGCVLGQYASFATRPQLQLSMADVTKDTPYYRWVFHDACRFACVDPWELHHVGIHVNVSDEQMMGDALIHATNWLRCLTPLFILFTANSPFEEGKPAGVLSRRMHRFPNRYDVPLWKNDAACRAWLCREEKEGRIYPGKARSWMPVAPRSESLEEPFTRVEVRSLDSGRGVPFSVIRGCCRLVEQIVKYALAGNALPLRSLEIDRLRDNDRAAACLGRKAHLWLDNKEQSILQVAWHWAEDIPELVSVLRGQSPAETALQGVPVAGH